MRVRLIIAAATILMLAAPAARSPIVDHALARPGTPPRTSSLLQPKVAAAFAKAPISFELNEGQVNSRVKFLARAPGYTLFLTSTEMVMAPRGPSSPSPSPLGRGERFRKSDGESGRWRLATIVGFSGNPQYESPSPVVGAYSIRPGAGG